MITPPLLLQRLPGKTCAKELSRLFDRCLTIWLSRDLASLLQEGCAIQARLTVTSSTKNIDNLSRKFSKLMFVGNVKAAIRLLAENECSGFHSLDTKIDDQSVKDILLEKHPPAQPLYPSTIVTSHSPNIFYSILFDSTSPELIRSTILKINGSSGPSGLDAAAWKKLCTSFHSSSADMFCSRFIDKTNMYLLYRSSWSPPTSCQ